VKRRYDRVQLAGVLLLGIALLVKITVLVLVLAERTGGPR
jgi:hypothetical protein